MENLNRLNIHRKADREKLADALCAVAAQHGATVERQEYPDDPKLYLSFTLDGAEAHIGIDPSIARELPVPLISWCARGGPGRCFSSNFICAARAGGGAAPHHKATSIPETLVELVDNLDGGLGAIRVGAAFRHYIHPWAAETAWIGAGKPEGDKAAWIEHYRATGERLYESPRVAAARKAFEEAGGLANLAAASAAADAAQAPFRGIQ